MTKNDRRIVTPGPDPRDRPERSIYAPATSRGANRAARRRDEPQPRDHRRNEGWHAANLEALPFLKKKRKAIAMAALALSGKKGHTHAHDEPAAKAEATDAAGVHPAE